MGADPLKIAQQLGDQVKKKPLPYTKGPDLLVTDAITDAPFAVLDGDSTVASIQLIAGADIAAGSASANFVVKKWVAGVPTTLATLSTTAGVSKMVPVSAAPPGSPVLQGSVLSVSILKLGGGVILPPCMILVETSPVTPS